MRKDREVAVPATTRTELESLTCELCGETTRYDGDWIDENYQFDEVRVYHRVGSCYPGAYGSSETKTILDMCPKCFTEKLISWFESQGGKVRTEEVD